MTTPVLPAAPRGLDARGRPAGVGVRVTGGLIAVAVALTIALTLTHAATATHPRAATAPPNPNALIAGSPLQSARCSNWLRASAADKALAIRALTYAVGGPTEYKDVRGTTLTTAEGYQLLDNACSNPIAGSFLLYELYIRAAAFRSLAVQQP